MREVDEQDELTNPDTANSSERVIYCTFSGIREQTPNDEKNPNMPANFQKRKYKSAEKDMRCIFKGN